MLSGGVADGCNQEFQVLVVQAWDGVAQRDGEASGEAGSELENALFPAAEGDLPVVQGAERVGFQNSAIDPELGFYATRSYSLMRPPRTGWRWIRFRERSAAR